MGGGVHPAARSLIDRIGTQWKHYCSASDRRLTPALISLGVEASAASVRRYGTARLRQNSKRTDEASEVDALRQKRRPPHVTAATRVENI